MAASAVFAMQPIRNGFIMFCSGTSPRGKRASPLVGLARMNSLYPSQLEVETGLPLSQAVIRPCMGILIADPISRRLVEAAAIQVELTPCIYNPHEMSHLPFEAIELIVADEPVARSIRTRLDEAERRGERSNAAVIAVREPDSTGAPSTSAADPDFDGVLRLPMLPGALAAQLSLILYAHRAFAQRYESALEELHLNRRIFRSVTSGISVANAEVDDLPLVYVNPAFEVMTGYSLEEVQGRNCRFLQGEDHDQPGLTVIRTALAERREALVVIKNYRKDGSAFWNELSLSPIRNRDGKLTHFVGIQTDVTSRVEFEAALRESEKLAAVGRLASSIAHEINNPLESVTNLLYLARNGTSTAETMRYLDLADKELQRVALITSQSLRFYKQSTRPQAIGCTALVESVLNLYESRAANAMVTLERRERSLKTVVCLESEIRQVLNNLVRNAIDAMAGKGGRLLIRTRDATHWASGAAGVTITIADTGSGMSEQTLKHIYKPFFTTKGLAGTGLGLWLSQEIISRHHGCLRVRSCQQPGTSGTVFSLFLPFHAA